MASNKTPNLGLDLWQPDDFFKRSEINNNFMKIDTGTKDNSDKIGELSNFKDESRYSQFIVPRHATLSSKFTEGTPFRGYLIGNSIAQGTGAGGVLYTIPTVLGDMLNAKFTGGGNNWSPTNHGVGGSTVANMLAYVSHNLDSKNDSLSKGYAFQYPYWIIIAGGNDADQLDLATFSKMYRTLIRMGMRAGVDVICVTKPPQVDLSLRTIPDHEGKHPAFAEEIRKIAADEGASLVDCHKEWWYRHNKGEDIFALSSDGTHPNKIGYWIMTDMIFRCLTSPSITNSKNSDANKPKRVGYYVLSQYNSSSLDKASIAALNGYTTGSTTRKNATNIDDVIEIQDGGYVDFKIPDCSAEGVIITVILTVGGGNIKVQSPPGLGLTSDFSTNGSIKREFSWFVKASSNTSYPMNEYVRVVALGGKVLLTGIHLVSPIMTTKHDTVRGIETGTWSISTDLSSSWKTSSTVGDKIEVTWYGTDLSIDIVRNNTKGILGYKTDMQTLQTIDLYSNSTSKLKSIVIASGLQKEWHTTVFSVETKNTNSSGNTVSIGNLKIYGVVSKGGNIIANAGPGISVFTPDGSTYVRSQQGIPVIGSNVVTNTSPGVVEILNR